MRPTDVGNPSYYHRVVDRQYACPAHTNVPEVAEDYDPTDRDLAYTHIRDRQKDGEVVTGLLYLSPDSRDLHEQLEAVDMPLVDVPYEDLCPGSAELDTLHRRFR